MLQFHFATVGIGIGGYISNMSGECPTGMMQTRDNAPPPHYKWMLDELGSFVEVRDYIAEYDAVDSKRRALYTQMCDPLYNKARRLERNGEIEKANDYYAQADAAVDKIESENPWPVNPETL